MAILQHKRGTTAKRLAYTPVDGELIYDTELNKIFIGNGTTAGGVSILADVNIPVFSASGPGLVPARVGAVATKYLREDGTWVTPTNTTYSAMSQTEANTGTATSSRVITAAVLKSAIQTHAPEQTSVTGNAGTATKLQTARTIGGVSFDGSANINLPGVNTAGNQSTSGNAATATKLATARTINGVAFDGTANITIGEGNSLFLGAVQWFNGNRASIPDGWLAADGQEVSRTTFPDLWAAAGTAFPIVSDIAWLASTDNRGSYSNGDGIFTFRLPDLNGAQTNSLKGLYLRGDGNGAVGIIGSTLDSQNKLHNHLQAYGAYYPNSARYGTITGGFDSSTSESTNGANSTNAAYTSSEGGDEARPVSAVGVWIIRAAGSSSPVPASGSAASLLANTFNGTQKIVGNLEVTGSLLLGVGFENNLTDFGYQKLPSGLIFQWGTSSLSIATSGVTTQHVTFPIAFTTKVIHVSTSYLETTGNSVDSLYTENYTATGFDLGQTSTTTHTCSWFAIGW